MSNHSLILTRENDGSCYSNENKGIWEKTTITKIILSLHMHWKKQRNTQKFQPINTGL